MRRAAAALMTSPTRRRQPMPPDNEADYEVGYGKPPRHTRFKKGRSGNPRGRPNGSKNLSTLLSETLSEPVIVAENGGGAAQNDGRGGLRELLNPSAQSAAA